MRWICLDTKPVRIGILLFDHALHFFAFYPGLVRVFRTPSATVHGLLACRAHALLRTALAKSRYRTPRMDASLRVVVGHLRLVQDPFAPCGAEQLLVDAEAQN